MICFYCNRECKKNNDLSATPTGWEYCDNHPITVHFLITIDGWAGLYRVYYKELSLAVQILKFFSEDKQIWRLKHDGKIIVEFDFLPKNLTPDNIYDKIDTLITFS